MEQCTPTNFYELADMTSTLLLVILVFRQQSEVFNRIATVIQETKERDMERFRLLMEAIHGKRP